MSITELLKYEGDNKTFIWKHPKEDFNTGSQLIVHETQEAIFLCNGEILDTFGPGKHTLETENLPVAKTLFKIGTGGESVFHAELYFVNLTEQMAIKWGTDDKIQYLDPEYNFPLEIGACGEMSVAVDNSRLLLTKIVGTEKIFSQEQFKKYFRAFLMTRIKSILPNIIKEKRINIFELDMHLGDLSKAIMDKLADDYINYGVKLRSFFITTVLKPDDDVNYEKFKELYFRQVTDVKEAELQQKLKVIEQETKAKQTIIEAESIAKKRELEGYTYQQEQSFQVTKEFAKNDAVAEFSNAGVGIGMMAGVGATIGQNIAGNASSAMNDASKQMVNQQSSVEVVNPVGAKFCVNCGSVLPGGAKFCPECGSKRG